MPTMVPLPVVADGCLPCGPLPSASPRPRATLLQGLPPGVRHYCWVIKYSTSALISSSVSVPSEARHDRREARDDVRLRIVDRLLMYACRVHARLARRADPSRSGTGSDRSRRRTLPIVVTADATALARRRAWRPPGLRRERREIDGRALGSGAPCAIFSLGNLGATSQAGLCPLIGLSPLVIRSASSLICSSSSEPPSELPQCGMMSPLPRVNGLVSRSCSAP